MGTSLANLHILGGNLEEIKALLPNAEVGIWSANSVSAFGQDFLPSLIDKTARSLSKKIPLPVLSAWIFDSDAVSFSIFQNGKCVVSHMLNPDGVSKMGNIPLFCQTWQLPKEDETRLRAVWKKGNAEEQLNLTSMLMGLPLYHDCEVLPDTPCQRDADAVDRWIEERPAPPRVKNKAKVELIQEIPKFRFKATHSIVCPFYVSADPYDDPYAYDGFHVWRSQPDGTIREIWCTDLYANFYTSPSRIVCEDFYSHAVLYDSDGLLRYDFCIAGQPLLLENGKILIHHSSGKDTYSVSCHAPDGTKLWQMDDLNTSQSVFSWNDQEIILRAYTKEALRFVRISLATGEKTETVDSPIGLNAYQAYWHDGAWWITHDGHTLKDGVWSEKGHFALTKLNRDLQKTAEVELPLYTQELFFDYCGKLAYVYICQNQILAIDLDNLSIPFLLKDKSFLAPLGFDDKYLEARFWMQRDGSTVEAWDNCLTKPMSRHRLKGEIVGHHRDHEDNLCVATWDDKKNTLRIYRLT